MKIIENMSFDEERALYGSNGLLLRGCRFDGAADGESALKECRNIIADNCFCNLRYPFWHISGLKITLTEMTELCRAALWYSDGIEIKSTKLHGIKALRECSEVVMTDCDIASPEFGWFVRGITMERCRASGEYFMFRSDRLHFSQVMLNGKYSFQYISDSVFEDCVFDTKDAFWHAKNVIVRNSVIKSEYLAWYCENLTFENCRLTGTQPLCYCKGLKLINCELENADLCFEKSDVNAVLTAPVISIKNPRSGHIRVPSVGEIIRDDEASSGKIIITE